MIRLCSARHALLLSLSWTLAACGGAGSGGDPPPLDPNDDGPGDAFLGSDGLVPDTLIGDGSGEARAVLRLANRSDAGELGSGGFGLGPRAVAAIVAARARPEQLVADVASAPMGTLEALDAVPYVGPKAWARLLAAAQAKGLPAALDPCGRGAAQPLGLPLPVDVTQALGRLDRRLATDRIEVWTRASGGLSDDVVQDYWARSCAALSFDLDELGIEPDDANLGAPLRVVVLSNADYASATGDPESDGVTFNATMTEGDAFVVPASAVAQPAELDDTLAHELVHMLQGRVAPGENGLPWYFLEGMAVNAGTHFGRLRNGYPTGFVRDYLEGTGGADAAVTFTRFDQEDQTTDTDQLGHDEAVGGLLVEYLRAVHPRGAGKGFPGTMPALTSAMVRSNGGASFDAAFEANFGGLTLAQAKRAFLAFMDATTASWAARTVGTVFEE